MNKITSCDSICHITSSQTRHHVAARAHHMHIVTECTVLKGSECECGPLVVSDHNLVKVIVGVVKNMLSEMSQYASLTFGRHGLILIYVSHFYSNLLTLFRIYSAWDEFVNHQMNKAF